MILFAVLFVVYSFDFTSEDRIVAYAVPHSHCDPGWKVPVQEYFAQNVSKILSNVVVELDKNPSRRFIWAEVVYFEMWWNIATDTEKELVINFVKNGQLNFVMGGWVSNDECVTSYKDTITQITTGNQYLESILGVKPTIGWQIDPFGASRSQASLHNKMGYKYHIINRVDDRLKFNLSSYGIPHTDILKDEKKLQFFWTPYPASSPSETIFSEVLYKHYSAPVGFDFENTNQTANPPITEDNVVQRSEVLANIIKERSLAYRTNKIMVPFGDDFRYQDAEIEFSNIDKLIEEIHSRPDFYGIDIQYATLEEYYKAIYPDLQQQPDLFPSKNDGGDFIPYDKCSSWYQEKYDLCITYWVGYYTSYPVFVKKLARDASRALSVMEVWDTLPPTSSSSLPSLEEENPLEDFRMTISLMQHHDTITGTFTPVTRTDSITKIMDAWIEGNKLLKDRFEGHLSKTDAGKEYVKDNLMLSQNEFFEGEEVIEFPSSSSSVGLTVWNHLGWRRSGEVVNITFYVEMGEEIEYTVLKGDGDVVIPYDVVYRGLFYSVSKGVELRKYEIYFMPDIPPLSYKTYFLQNSTIDVLGSQRVVIEKSCPKDEMMEISNDHYSLQFTNGEISKIITSEDQYDFTNTFWIYEGWGDDAYRFRPQSDPVEIQWEEDVSNCVYVNGTFLKEVKKFVNGSSSNPGLPVVGGMTSQAFRIWSGQEIEPTIEVDFEVYLPQDGFDTAELVVRFYVPKIENSRNLFHDTNGYGLIERSPFDPSYYNDTSLRSHYAGNYYPMSSVSGIQSTDDQFVLYTKSSYGVTSSEEGVLETMIARNSNDEDPDSINAYMYSPYTIPFLLQLRSLKNTDGSNVEIQKTSRKYENPLYATILPLGVDSVDVGSDLNLEDSFLEDGEELDEDVHLLTLRKSYDQNGTTMMRMENLDESDTKSVEIEWRKGMDMKDVYSYDLTFSVDKKEMEGGNKITGSIPPLGFENVMFSWETGGGGGGGGDDNKTVIIIVVCSVVAVLLICCFCLSCICIVSIGFLLVLSSGFLAISKVRRKKSQEQGTEGQSLI